MKNGVVNGSAQLFPKLPIICEKDRRAAILHYLRSRGVVHSITDSSPVMNWENGEKKFHKKVSQPGWPDITAIHPLNGRFWGIETKNADGSMSPAQKQMREQIEDCGGIYTIARSVDDVARILDFKE